MTGGSDEIVPVKIGEYEIPISKKWPKLFANIIPGKWLLAPAARDAVAEALLTKLRQGEAFDQADVQFAEKYFGAEVARFIRLKRILDRGATVLKQLPASSEAGEANSEKPETPSDWANRFSDDAGLVDDETLQEVYARLLAGEAVRPGSFSMRTLGVLRYLDPTVAQLFGKLQPYVIDGLMVPERSDFKVEYERAGLGYLDFVELEDSGLLKFSPAGSEERSRAHLVRLQSQAAALRVHKENGDEFLLQPTANILTRAGQELARISEVPYDQMAVLAVGKFLVGRCFPQGKDYRVGMTRLPSRNWEGDFDALSWFPAPVYPVE